MLKAEKVCKRFGDHIVLQDLDCHVDNGTIYGLVGFNGAGKTTLLKIMAGIYKPEGGSAFLDGQNVWENEEAKQRTLFVPDDVYFLPRCTMKSMAKFYKGFYPNLDFTLFQKLANIFELDTSKRLSGFSKGMKRQAAVILALSCRPELLLLDESFDGLDPIKRKLLKQVLLEAIAQQETSIIISSHNLRELSDLCDHIGQIRDRRIVFDCAVEDVVATRVKCRVAFAHEQDEQMLQALSPQNLTKSGRILMFETTSTEEQIKTALQPAELLLLEILPMTLEEILISQGGAKEYDLSNLF